MTQKTLDIIERALDNLGTMKQFAVEMHKFKVERGEKPDPVPARVLQDIEDIKQTRSELGLPETKGMMNDEKCGTCRFYMLKTKGPVGEDVGNCRLRPPVVNPSGIDRQPDVFEHEWCGQWTEPLVYSVVAAVATNKGDEMKKSKEDSEAKAPGPKIGDKVTITKSPNSGVKGSITDIFVSSTGFGTLYQVTTDDGSIVYLVYGEFSVP